MELGRFFEVGGAPGWDYRVDRAAPGWDYRVDRAAPGHIELGRFFIRESVN